MTKTRRPGPRTLALAELAAVTGGYTLTPSTEVALSSGVLATLQNLSKPASETTATTTSNLK